MAKATINTGADAQPVHTRTTSDSAESQVSVIGIDGSDGVVPADATNGLGVDIKRAVLAADAATQTTLAAVLAKLIAAPATEATLAAIAAKLPAALLLGALAVTEGGTYGYAAGTAAATVDVPTGARVKRVSVLPGAGTATVTIAGGDTITIPQGGGFDEQIPGQATSGGDVVIGGTVSSYYVSWVS